MDGQQNIKILCLSFVSDKAYFSPIRYSNIHDQTNFSKYSPEQNYIHIKNYSAYCFALNSCFLFNFHVNTY